MPEPADQPSKPLRTWQPMVLWSVAILLVATAALAVALVPMRRQQREAAIAADGLRAAQEFAKTAAREEAEKYLAWRAASPEDIHHMAKLTGLPELSVPGIRIQEALVLGYGKEQVATCIASSSDEPLDSIQSKPRPHPSAQGLGVKQSQGVIRLRDGTRLPAWVFEVSLAVDTAKSGAPALDLRGLLVIVDARECPPAPAAARGKLKAQKP